MVWSLTLGHVLCWRDGWRHSHWVLVTPRWSEYSLMDYSGTRAEGNWNQGCRTIDLLEVWVSPFVVSLVNKFGGWGCPSKEPFLFRLLWGIFFLLECFGIVWWFFLCVCTFLPCKHSFLLECSGAVWWFLLCLCMGVPFLPSCSLIHEL